MLDICELCKREIRPNEPTRTIKSEVKEEQAPDEKHDRGGAHFKSLRIHKVCPKRNL